MTGSSSTTRPRDSCRHVSHTEPTCCRALRHFVVEEVTVDLFSVVFSSTSLVYISTLLGVYYGPHKTPRVNLQLPESPLHLNEGIELKL